MFALMLCASGTHSAHAADAVEICFNYGCARREEVQILDADLDAARALLGQPADADEERERLGRAVALLYVAAARTTPIANDRGGNFPFDTGVSGVMDCIDHSVNTTAFLAVLQKHGLLHFHEAGPRLKRMRFLAEHWAGQVTERATGAVYAVDSWYFDHGEPAAVMPEREWRWGRDPREL